jgi:hypothetical protein
MMSCQPKTESSLKRSLSKISVAAEPLLFSLILTVRRSGWLQWKGRVGYRKAEAEDGEAEDGEAEDGEAEGKEAESREAGGRVTSFSTRWRSVLSTSEARVSLGGSSSTLFSWR